jgi:hypothetical protein
MTMNIPMNHKTIFLLDHCNYFSSYCGETFEFDIINKPKLTAQNQTNLNKFPPLQKTIWSCLVESIIEYSRIVYDLFPDNKLLRLLVTKMDNSLNSWDPNEQGLDHLMSILGAVPPPFVQRERIEGEEFLNLCKSLDTAVQLIAQPTQIQLNTAQNYSIKTDAFNNKGRIILFTSSKYRNIETIQEFLVKSIEKYNDNVEQLNKTNM